MEVELSLFKLRATFKWGTVRIQQGLLNLPSFILDSVHTVQRIQLSRETINNILSKSNQNGYLRYFKRWKFFRAKEPDELWQINFRGPFSVQGKKYWFMVSIDAFSRFIVSVEQFDHELTTAETVSDLEKLRRHPKAILSDYGPQFKEQWKNSCCEHGVEAHFTHPSYRRTRAKWSGAFST
jgi:transposase InsO family protein